jgi:hypothetical protein
LIRVFNIPSACGGVIDYSILGGMDGGPKCGKEVKRRAFAE